MNGIQRRRLMKKSLRNFMHKKLIIITIIAQLLILVEGTAVSVVANAQEKEQQYSEYTETMRHVEEHLEEHSRSNFEINRAIIRTNLRGKMREVDITPTL